MNKLQSMITYPVDHKEFKRVLPVLCNMMNLRYVTSSDGPMSNKSFNLTAEDDIKVDWVMDTVGAEKRLLSIKVSQGTVAANCETFEEAITRFRELVGNQINENPMNARIVDTLHPSVKILRMGETDVSLYSVANLLLVSDNTLFLNEFGLKYDLPLNPVEVKRDLQHHAVSARLRVCELDVVDPLHGVCMLHLLTANLDSIHMVFKEAV